MLRPAVLPPLPKARFIVLEDRRVPEDDRGGFLGLRRATMRVEMADGSVSEPFVYDTVDRARLDAVVIVAHYLDAQRRRHVFLRSCMRPPLALRPLDARPFPEREDLGNLWELPAGLVEVDERSPEGLRRCASRELLEELGFRAPPDRFAELGPSMFPAPGMIGERHFYFEVEVDPRTRVTPTEDGSALERNAIVADILLTEALDLARRGVIEDSKTELALRRLAELPG